MPQLLKSGGTRARSPTSTTSVRRASARASTDFGPNSTVPRFTCQVASEPASAARASSTPNPSVSVSARSIGSSPSTPGSSTPPTARVSNTIMLSPSARRSSRSTARSGAPSHSMVTREKTSRPTCSRRRSSSVVAAGASAGRDSVHTFSTRSRGAVSSRAPAVVVIVVVVVVVGGAAAGLGAVRFFAGGASTGPAGSDCCATAVRQALPTRIPAPATNDTACRP